MYSFKRSLLSRKFLLATVSAIVVFCNAMFGWGLTDDQVWAILAPVLTYIGVEGVADVKAR